MCSQISRDFSKTKKIKTLKGLSITAGAFLFQRNEKVKIDPPVFHAKIIESKQSFEFSFD